MPVAVPLVLLAVAVTFCPGMRTPTVPAQVKLVSPPPFVASCPTLSFETCVTFLWYGDVAGNGLRSVGRLIHRHPRACALPLPSPAFRAFVYSGAGISMADTKRGRFHPKGLPITPRRACLAHTSGPPGCRASPPRKEVESQPGYSHDEDELRAGQREEADDRADHEEYGGYARVDPGP